MGSPVQVQVATAKTDQKARFSLPSQSMLASQVRCRRAASVVIPPLAPEKMNIPSIAVMGGRTLAR